MSLGIILPVHILHEGQPYQIPNSPKGGILHYIDPDGLNNTVTISDHGSIDLPEGVKILGATFDNTTYLSPQKLRASIGSRIEFILFKH